MGYVGSSVKRVEDPRFIQGKGSYVGNITMPGMVHLAIKRSPYGHANIKKINIKNNNRMNNSNAGPIRMETLLARDLARQS